MKNKQPKATVKAGQPKELKAKRASTGPEPERLKIEGNWIEAVDKSLAVKRPPGGWPK